MVSESTFSDIYTTYFRKSFFFVKSFVHDDMAAEDITSDALIKLWNIMKTEEVRHLEVLLFVILKDKSLDYLRHEELKRNAINSITNWQDRELCKRINTLQACDPNEIFSDEVLNIIRCTLKQLSPQTQQIFMMSRFEDKSNKEISMVWQTRIWSIRQQV
jgi:RNA polymerase sigma factor, sigma-70 family